MSCPHCGGSCHCLSSVSTVNSRSSRPRFEPDRDTALRPAKLLINSAEHDTKQDEFSRQVKSPALPASRFVPDQPARAAAEGVSHEVQKSGEIESHLRAQAAVSPGQAIGARSNGCEDFESDPAGRAEDLRERPRPGNRASAWPDGSSVDDDRWKQEVAARVNSYRSRRKPRPPKYPSLSLNFELPSPVRRQTRAPETQSAPDHVDGTDDESAAMVASDAGAGASNVSGARVIEFPRFFPPPETSPDELAEPVLEQLRILDAPEVGLPAPALGGIVLETTEEQEFKDRPGFEVPLHSAPISRRAFAATIDWLLVAASGAMFGYIFIRLVTHLPPLPLSLGCGAILIAALWAGYHYLLLTYSGSTPGLSLFRLRLRRFDGSPVPRSTRRWRVVASILSGLSLGLGFAWCFLDEDTLSWHDRITRTHLVSAE